jgi:hypothetical protein
MIRIATAVVLLALSGFARAVSVDSAAASSVSASAPGRQTPPGVRRAERAVMDRPEVKAWSAAVRKAGRTVKWRDDVVIGKSRCTDVTLYEDAGPYLTRFGTWRACGAEVKDCVTTDESRWLPRSRFGH